VEREDSAVFLQITRSDHEDKIAAFAAIAAGVLDGRSRLDKTMNKELRALLVERRYWDLLENGDAKGMQERVPTCALFCICVVY
jgi:hypothetical protein